MKPIEKWCLADTNGDGYIDEQELEALFTKEVCVAGVGLVLKYVCVCVL